VESGDGASTRERHADAFALFAETHQPQLWAAGAWERERAELFAEFDNIREAFDWMVESGASERALDLLLGIDVLWAAYTSPRDGLEWMQRALGASNPTPEARARALAQAARLAFLAGDPAVADALAAESTVVADAAGTDVPSVAVGTRGFVAAFDDDDARAFPLFERYLELARVEGAVFDISLALSNLAQSSSALGDQEAAIEYAEESMRVAQEGVADSTLSPHYWTGLLALSDAYRVTDPARARECLEQCYTISHDWMVRGTTNFVGASSLRFGQFEAWSGNARAAGVHLRQALAIYSQFGGNYGIAAALEGLAFVVAHFDGAEPGARILGAADRIRAAIGAKGRHADIEGREATIASLTEALGTDKLERLRGEGKTLATDDAIALALAETDFLDVEAERDA
jgi:tetratricopeptide (TPR) repeat protein